MNYFQIRAGEAQGVTLYIKENLALPKKSLAKTIAKPVSLCQYVYIAQRASRWESIC